MKHTKTFFMTMTVLALAACSQNPPQTVPTAVSAVADALVASDVHQEEAVVVAVPAVAENASPKEQAQALRDLMVQLRPPRRLAEPSNTQWTPQQIRENLNLAIIASRQNIDNLKSLNIKDSEAIVVRDALASSLLLEVEMLDLQVRATLASERQENEKADQFEQILLLKTNEAKEMRQSAEMNYQALLQKHQIQP